jgi:hypothetical protein
MYRKKNEFYDDYLAGLILFVKSTAKQIKEENPNTSLTNDGDVIQTYLIDISNAGISDIQEYDYLNDAVLAKHIAKKNIPITLSLYLLDSGDLGYSFTLPDGSKSEIFSQTEIEGVSREISSLMKSFDNYTFHPTSINLKNLDIKMYSQYTSLALSEKNRFELLIEKNLGLI